MEQTVEKMTNTGGKTRGEGLVRQNSLAEPSRGARDADVVDIKTIDAQLPLLRNTVISLVRSSEREEPFALRSGSSHW